MYETEVYEHKTAVQIIMNKIIHEMMYRAKTHDNSKLKSPEKEIYSKYNDELKRTAYGSDRYNMLMKNMAPAVQHHYRENDHHPEHFEDGIFDMNLFQIQEMLVDWFVVAKAKGVDLVDELPTLMQQHNIPENYYMVFKNTVERLKEFK